MPEYLLDACALIAFFNKEEGWLVVKGLIEQSERREIKLSINLVNLVEVHYDRIREEGPRKADEIINRMYDSSIVVIEDMGRSISNEAAHLKATGGMSLADTFLVATAACTGATLVTSDWTELEPVAAQGNIPFCWIRPKPKSKKA